MAEGVLDRIVALQEGSVADAIVAMAGAHQNVLVHLEASQSDAIVRAWTQARADLSQTMQSLWKRTFEVGVTPTPAQVIQFTQAHELLQGIDSRLSTLGIQTQAAMGSGFATGAETGFEHANLELQPLIHDFGGPGIVGRTVFGKLQDVGFDLGMTAAVNETRKLTDEVRTALTTGLIQGAVQGEGIRDIVKRLEPLEGVGAKRAELISRWSVMKGYNAGRENAYTDAATVIDGLESMWLCLSGETRVRAQGVTHVARRWHEGSMARVETASGIGSLEVTTDHPVLTCRGWVPAEQVQVGDYLISYAFDQDPVPGDPDVEGVPPKIREVFDAAHQVLPATRMVGRVVDLYGQSGRRNPDVQVVAIEGHLGDTLQIPGLEPSEHVPLVPTDLALADLVADGRVAEVLCCQGDADTLGTTAFRPFREHLVPLTLGPEHASLARAPQGDAQLLEVGANGRLGASQGFGHGASGLPAEVSLHEVVQVKIVPWAGHVYDLTTRSGWMSANGVVVHNCERDERTCPHCLAHHGEHVPVGTEFDKTRTFANTPQKVYGDVLEYPPQHPRCRCVLVSWHERWRGLATKTPEDYQAEAQEAAQAAGFPPKSFPPPKKATGLRSTRAGREVIRAKNIAQIPKATRQATLNRFNSCWVGGKK